MHRNGCRSGLHIPVLIDKVICAHRKPLLLCSGLSPTMLHYFCQLLQFPLEKEDSYLRNSCKTTLIVANMPAMKSHVFRAGLRRPFWREEVHTLATHKTMATFERIGSAP